MPYPRLSGWAFARRLQRVTRPTSANVRIDTPRVIVAIHGTSAATRPIVPVAARQQRRQRICVILVNVTNVVRLLACVQWASSVIFSLVLLMRSAARIFSVNVVVSAAIACTLFLTLLLLLLRLPLPELLHVLCLLRIRPQYP